MVYVGSSFFLCVVLRFWYFMCVLAISLGPYMLVPVFLAFITLSLASSALSKIFAGTCEERLRSDLFCVEWDAILTL